MIQQSYGGNFDPRQEVVYPNQFGCDRVIGSARTWKGGSLMRSTYFKFIVILTVGLLISGCYFKSVPKEEGRATHNLLIVPFKASPIKIRDWGSGTVLVGGAIGTAIVDETTKEGREKVVNMLNEVAGQWDPSVVVAQECLNLINGYKALRIEKVTIVDAREMPGTEAMRLREPRRFTPAPVSGGGDWTMEGARFIKKSKSLIQYGQEYPQSGADLALELFPTYIHIIRMKKIQLMVIAKLVDTSSGKKIALSAHDGNFPISLDKDLSNFRRFEDEFRNASRELCRETLKKMGLILVP